MPGIIRKSFRLFLLMAIFLWCGQVVSYARTVGVIMTGDIPYYRAAQKAMLEEISSYLSDNNIEVITQTPLPNPMSWTNAARKLKALGVEAVVTYGLPATLATMKEASEIPVVFAGVFSPETMSIGGRMVTGVSSTVSIRQVLRHMQEISNLSNIGIVFNKTEKDSIIQAREVKKFEKNLGFSTVLLNLSGKFEAERLATCDAVVLTSCSAGMCKPHLPEIVSLARQYKVPTIALISGAESMVVLTFTPSADEQGRKAAGMLRKVLDGESPGNIPVQNPDEIELIVNLKEARGMGVDVPAGLVDAASRVIE